MKIIGDTVTSEVGSCQEKFDLNLDGRETVVTQALRLSFKRIDDMSFTIVADGVAASEQRASLLTTGCEQGHGFLFSKAVSAEDTTAFFANQSQMLAL